MDRRGRTYKTGGRCSWVLVVKAEVPEGEEGTWISRIEKDELENMLPLLKEIKNHNGYFPTGIYRVEEDPKPEILYSHLPGWTSLLSRLPTPKTGIKRIIEIHILSEPLKSLYM